MDPNHIRLEHYGIMTTTHCNLNCKLCITGTPMLASEGKDMPLDRTAKSCDVYFQIVEHVKKLALGGGEPLLVPRLGELIEHLMQYQNQFDELEIITNGTLIPPQNLLDVLTAHRGKVTVMVDNYGEHSPLADQAGKLLTEKGIRNRVRIYYGDDCHCGGWVDLGDFSLKHPTREEQISLFQRCAYHTKTTKIGVCSSDGLLFTCGRAYLTLYKKLVPLEPPHFIDLLNPAKGIPELRQELVDMLNIECPSACAYCNGMCADSERFMPAEQMPRTKK